jgi:hypothetical protein
MESSEPSLRQRVREQRAGLAFVAAVALSTLVLPAAIGYLGLPAVVAVAVAVTGLLIPALVLIWRDQSTTGPERGYRQSRFQEQYRRRMVSGSGVLALCFLVASAGVAADLPILLPVTLGCAVLLGSIFLRARMATRAASAYADAVARNGSLLRPSRKSRRPAAQRAQGRPPR